MGSVAPDHVIPFCWSNRGRFNLHVLHRKKRVEQLQCVRIFEVFEVKFLAKNRFFRIYGKKSFRLILHQQFASLFQAFFCRNLVSFGHFRAKDRHFQKFALDLRVRPARLSKYWRERGISFIFKQIFECTPSIPTQNLSRSRLPFHLPNFLRRQTHNNRVRERANKHVFAERCWQAYRENRLFTKN